MSIPEYVNPDGSFKYTKLGKDLNEAEKICEKFKEWARNRYVNPYLKSILPKLEHEIDKCKLTGIIDPSILLSIAMPPLPPSNFKFDSCLSGEVSFDIPEKYMQKE